MRGGGRTTEKEMGRKHPLMDKESFAKMQALPRIGKNGEILCGDLSCRAIPVAGYRTSKQ